jgi:hypothetical protein
MIRRMRQVTNPRINRVNQGFNSVVGTMKVRRKSDVCILISVLSMAHLQLPFCKVSLLWILSQPHIDFERKDL